MMPMRRAGESIARALPVAWVVPGALRQLTGGYLYDARIVDGLRALGWPVGVLDVRATGWPVDPAAARRLVGGLGRQGWSAVVVDELAHPALVAAGAGGRLRAAMRGAPLILLVHHLRCSEPAAWPTRALARVVEQLAVRSADVVVCTSTTTAGTVRPLVRQGAPIAVVRPGWDTHAAALTPAAPAERHTEPALTPALSQMEREHRGERSGGLRLLLVGHWTPRKGILEALAALGRVRADVTLDLVGEQERDPAYAARVRAALRDPALAGRVRVHGRIGSDVLAGLFGDADALLLPSTHEGYGMVLAEALAAGLPIVAARVGAVPEVVRDGLEAELTPAGDVGALAWAIDRLAADPDERRRRAAYARERADSLPRWAESVAAFDALLREQARAPRGGLA
jgi:glycosyltransferase involved in cell wall biosynthesis